MDLQGHIYRTLLEYFKRLGLAPVRMAGRGPFIKTVSPHVPGSNCVQYCIAWAQAMTEGPTALNPAPVKHSCWPSSVKRRTSPPRKGVMIRNNVVEKLATCRKQATSVRQLEQKPEACLETEWLIALSTESMNPNPAVTVGAVLKGLR